MEVEEDAKILNPEEREIRVSISKEKGNLGNLTRVEPRERGLATRKEEEGRS